MDNFQIISWWSKLSSSKQKIWLSIFIENMNVNKEINIKEKAFLESKLDNEDYFIGNDGNNIFNEYKINDLEPLFERTKKKKEYSDIKIKGRSKSMSSFKNELSPKIQPTKSMEEFVNEKLKETRIFLKETERSLEEVNKLKKKKSRIRDQNYNIDLDRYKNNELFVEDIDDI